MCLSSERHLGLWLWWFLRALASLTECSLGASSLESHKDSWQAAVKCINGKRREQVVGPMQVSFLMLCPREDRWSVDTSRKQGVCTLLWNSKYASCSLFLTSDIVEDNSQPEGKGGYQVSLSLKWKPLQGWSKRNLLPVNTAWDFFSTLLTLWSWNKVA